MWSQEEKIVKNSTYSSFRERIDPWPASMKGYDHGLIEPEHSELGVNPQISRVIAVIRELFCSWFLV